MKVKRTIAALTAILMLLLMLGGCGSISGNTADSTSSTTTDTGTDTGATPDTAPDAASTVNAAVLKGPTGMGAVYLMDDAANGKTNYQYNFTVSAAPDELKGKLISGELDIAAVPTNLAAILYNKTEGDVQVLAVNTLGVLYILDSTGTVKSISDLKGQTIYASGQGSTPEYILDYILESAGLEPGKDVQIEWSAAHDELAALMAAGKAPIAMLPEPYVSAVMAKSADYSIALDMTKAYETATGGTTLAMGCIVGRKDFISANPQVVEDFLDGWKASVDKVQGDYNAAAALIAQYGITGSEAIALSALPNSSLTFMTGDEMRQVLDRVYQMFYNADPTSVGGTLPDEGIYAS